MSVRHFLLCMYLVVLKTLNYIVNCVFLICYCFTIICKKQKNVCLENIWIIWFFLLREALISRRILVFTLWHGKEILQFPLQSFKCWTLHGVLRNKEELFSMMLYRKLLGDDHWTSHLIFKKNQIKVFPLLIIT